jgi:hypothetical protein
MSRQRWLVGNGDVILDIRGIREQDYWTARNAAEELMRTITLASGFALFWNANAIGSDKAVLGLTEADPDGQLRFNSERGTGSC